MSPRSADHPVRLVIVGKLLLQRVPLEIPSKAGTDIAYMTYGRRSMGAFGVARRLLVSGSHAFQEIADVPAHVIVAA